MVAVGGLAALRSSFAAPPLLLQFSFSVDMTSHGLSQPPNCLPWAEDAFLRTTSTIGIRADLDSDRVRGSNRSNPSSSSHFNVQILNKRSGESFGSLSLLSSSISSTSSNALSPSAAKPISYVSTIDPLSSSAAPMWVKSLSTATNDSATVKAAAAEAVTLARAAASAAKEAAAMVAFSSSSTADESFGYDNDVQVNRKGVSSSIARRRSLQNRDGDVSVSSLSPIGDKTSAEPDSDVSISTAVDSEIRKQLEDLLGSSLSSPSFDGDSSPFVGGESVPALFEVQKYPKANSFMPDDCKAHAEVSALHGFDQHKMKSGAEIPIMNTSSGEEKLTIAVNSRRKAIVAKRHRKPSKSSLPLSQAVSGKNSRKFDAPFDDVWNNTVAAKDGGSLMTFGSTIGGSRLLSAAEEVELSKGIQELMKLERLRKLLAVKLDQEPTREEWANAAARESGRGRGGSSNSNLAELEMRLARGRNCRDQMVASNMRLVVSVAKKYVGRGIGLEDLITEGCLGLVRGAEKFDHRKGFKFSTYAHWWIKQAVFRSIAEQSRLIRLPLHMYELTSRISKAKRMLVDELGRQPLEEEVAELVGMDVSKLKMVTRSIRTPASMEKSINSDGDETIGDLVADTSIEAPEDAVSRQWLQEELQKLLHVLNPREREIMGLRYGLHDGRLRSLEEVGRHFHVTRERIRQLEMRALRKMRQQQQGRRLQEMKDLVLTDL